VEIILRASVMFFFVWLLMRALGKRELSEMTAFELVLVISIGDLIQQAITQEDMSMTGAMLAVGTIAAWILGFSYLEFRSQRARPLVDSFPVIIVRDGRPLEEMLRLERITVEEVLGAARRQGIEDLAEVRVGILEEDGRFSFMTAEGHVEPDERRFD
jgi:uncharacterized membrane protein YcaP (DUF421 family)